MEFWHGGRRWEGGAEVQPAKTGRYECGVGIYLTNHYLRARKYASGGKVTTKVELSESVRWLEDASLPVDELLKGLESIPRLKNKAWVKKDFLERSQDRGMTGESFCPVSYLVNTLINREALAGKAGVLFTAWLVEKGIDASLHKVSSNGEQWVVVFNPAVIKKYRVVSASDVPLSDYELPQVKQKEET